MFPAPLFLFILLHGQLYFHYCHTTNLFIFLSEICSLFPPYLVSGVNDICVIFIILWLPANFYFFPLKFNNHTPLGCLPLIPPVALLCTQTGDYSLPQADKSNLCAYFFFLTNILSSLRQGWCLSYLHFLCLAHCLAHCKN